jgi:uncharacterized protein with HEPN domain
MRDNALLARSFVAGLDADGFAHDLRTRYAVTRCLEIISEDSRRVEPAIRERHPALPWRAIGAAGNIYRHEYDNLDAALLWRTVQDSLPAIVDFAEVELACLGP